MSYHSEKLLWQIHRPIYVTFLSLEMHEITFIFKIKFYLNLEAQFLDDLQAWNFYIFIQISYLELGEIFKMVNCSFYDVIKKGINNL